MLLGHPVFTQFQSAGEKYNGGYAEHFFQRILVTERSIVEVLSRAEIEIHQLIEYDLQKDGWQQNRKEKRDQVCNIPPAGHKCRQQVVDIKITNANDKWKLYGKIKEGIGVVFNNEPGIYSAVAIKNKPENKMVNQPAAEIGCPFRQSYPRKWIISGRVDRVCHGKIFDSISN